MGRLMQAQKWVTPEELEAMYPDDPYARGYHTADLLSNPYPDNSTEARRFVDGWVDGRKWAKQPPR